MSEHGSAPMLKTDQFWQYAKEAILSAYDAKTDTDKQGLLELVQTWTQAALLDRAPSVDHFSPIKARTAQASGDTIERQAV
jgi:hypothetical protein